MKIAGFRSAFALLFALLYFPITSTAAETAQRISLEDRLLIQELFAHYAHSWDSKDVERYVNLFTEDAVFSTYLDGQPAGEFSSHDELRGYAEALTSTYRAAGIQTRHYITNTVLTPQADGTIKAQTYFQVLQQQDGDATPTTNHTGTYTDIFVNTPEGWKFQKHEVRLDHG